MKQMQQRTFMVRYIDAATLNDTACRIAFGPIGLRAAVHEHMGVRNLTEDSSARMRFLIESSDEDILVGFRGYQSMNLYSASGGRRIEVFLVTGSHGQ